MLPPWRPQPLPSLRLRPKVLARPVKLPLISLPLPGEARILDARSPLVRSRFHCRKPLQLPAPSVHPRPQRRPHRPFPSRVPTREPIPLHSTRPFRQSSAAPRDWLRLPRKPLHSAPPPPAKNRSPDASRDRSPPHLPPPPVRAFPQPGMAHRPLASLPEPTRTSPRELLSRAPLRPGPQPQAPELQKPPRLTPLP